MIVLPALSVTGYDCANCTGSDCATCIVCHPSPYQRDASTGCSILVLCHIESAALCVTLLQAGETPQQAAAKNVKRETGLDLDPSRFRAVCTASYLWSMRKQEPSSTWVLGVCGWSAA